MRREGNRKSKCIWGNPGRLRGETIYDQLISTHALGLQGVRGGAGGAGVVENAFQTEGTVVVNAYKKSRVSVYILLVGVHNGACRGRFNSKASLIQSVKQSGI